MWEDYSNSELSQLAERWVEELKRDPPVDQLEVSDAIVLLSFTAPVDKQWTFVLAAIDASDEDQLWSVAAGPLEDLLARHGSEVIDRVEIQARQDAKFAWTLTGVWRNSMSDEIWTRVQVLQERAEKNPWVGVKR